MNNYKNIQSSSSSALQQRAVQKTKRFGMISLVPILAVMGLMLLFWHISPIASLTLAPTTPLAPIFRHVAANGSGTVCSVDNPCPLQTAVSQSADGDEVRVAAGNYSIGNPVLFVTQSITIAGGYTTTNRFQVQDPLLNSTVLNGNNTKGVIEIDNNASPIIEGFRIRNGNSSNGAGIYILDSTGTGFGDPSTGHPIIQNNWIQNNSASFGSAIFVGSLNVTIENNEISNNSATAGAIWLLFGNTILNLKPHADILFNNIHDNTASGSNGGGIFVSSNSSIFAEGNEIYNNSGNSGGGVYIKDDGTATMQNNMVYQNTASIGGGVYTFGNLESWNNTFAGNVASAGVGGGIFIANIATIQISNTIVASNTATSGESGINLSAGGTISGGGYNNYFNNSSNVIFGTDFITNPGFINYSTMNLHLRLGSDNVDAADSNTSPAINQDIDKQARPNGAFVDVGADEFYANIPDFSLTPLEILPYPYEDRSATAVYTHTLENQGTIDDTYTFTCSNSLGWTVTCPSSQSLQVGASLVVPTSVDIPAVATALSKGVTQITATSTISPLLHKRVSVSSIVQPIPGIQFTPNYTDSVKPGDIITLTHTITNLGDAPDTFNVTINSDPLGWGQIVPNDPLTVPLGIGGVANIQVQINVPPDSASQLANVTEIQAASSYDVNIFATVYNTVTARETAGTRYVRADGTDTNNNCTQVSNPCLTASQAISQAITLDEIRIAAGTYDQNGEIDINETLFVSGRWLGNFSKQEPFIDTTLRQVGNERIFNIQGGISNQSTFDNLILKDGIESAANGGAVFVGNGVQVGFSNITIQTSQANNGGAMVIGQNAFARITKGEFLTNTASIHGGGIYVDGGTLILKQSIFEGNQATGANGGGVYIKDGLFTAENTLYNDNSADNGGGLYIDQTPATLNFNTFVNNASSTQGGGIYADNANGIAVDVLNTILVSNTANTDGGAIYSTNSISPVVNLDYTNIWNNSAPELVNIGTNSNPFTLPPQFDDKQFRLAVGSPLVDQLARGTSQIVPQPVVDFEDDFRPSDQGYDLGYDELAGCSAKRDNVIYGSIQEAIDVVNPQSDLILVSGICRGVNQMVDVNGQTISQTVHITGSQSLIIQGGWLGDFSNRRVDETTLLDPELKGRALYISSPVSVTFEFFTFVNGQAAGLGGGPAGEDAGGSVYNNGGNLTLDAISIYTGTAELGGAVYHHDGFTNFGLKNPANATNFLIDQNQVGTILLGEMWANTAAADGGALYVYSNTVAVDSVYIHNNTAVNGAGIYNENGVLTATNNILSINDASNDGGAIYNASPYTTTLLHLTVVTNTAVNDGGGIYYPGGALSVTIQSNIFEGNSTSGSGEAIFAPGTADVDYNYYYGQSNPVAGGTTTGTHSINTLTIPPGLIDPANGDFHLQNDAPAADVGNPASPVNHDIDDEPRPSNQGPDAGADELVGCRVDLNGTLYGSIQTAMQNAQTGDTLKVAGRCSGVHDYDTGNTSGLGCADTSGIIQTTVHVDQNIILKGGWSDDFGTWDPLLFPTTLDARQLGRVLYFSPGVTATVEHFHIIQGFISNNGAGVCIDNATPKLNNNYIYSNTANTGGGMYSYDSKAQIDGNWIHHNNAINGAGIAAAVSGSVSASDSIWNNFVYSNTATLGGGYYNESGDHNFWHNTLVGNAATSNGGAAYANAASPDIRSNIFYNNSSSGTDGVHGGVGSTPTVEFNDFFGQTSNVGGTIGSLDPSNLTVDPLFNTSTYTLTIHSPVVDQGDPGVTLTYDFEGDIRMSHQGFDIGADEIGGCFAIIQGQPTPVYGSVQQAVDLAVSGDTVLVDGVCKRTNTRTNSSSDTVTQTLFIDKQLTVDGSWEYPLDPETHLSATLNALIYGRVLYVDSSGSVTLTNITLKNGDATLAGLGNNGGGAYNDGDLIVLNARLQSNLAGNGGAIYNNANLTSIHSRIVNNLATNGGGIYNEATAVITSVNSIVFNSATGNGGGIFQNNGDIIVDSNRIAVNNTATGDGGGLYLAGGTGNNVEIRNNFIYRNNAANNGGGLHNADTDASIWHNTFRINQAGSGFGGGLYSADRTALITIRSNIIDLNTGSGIHTDGPHDIAFNNVVNNIIDNYSGTASAGTGDISATPMYEDVLADDYHLKKLSPGLDVADPNVPFVHDIDGDIRPTNGGPDMGADELNSCLIRVIDTQDSSHHIFAVLQRAIDFAEGLPAFPIPTIEIARGECSGVEADSQNGGSLQVGAVHQDLNLIGSLDRDDFSFTNDYHRDDVDTVSSVINAEGLGRVLQVHNNANIFIKNLAFVGGDATLSGNGTNGGGIHNADSSINADETFICANTADNGGGYYGGSSSYSDLSGFLMGRCMTADVVENSNGTLNVNYFIHSGNNANADGGGMYSAGDFDLRNIIFWDNDAGQDGGGLFNSQLGNRIINGIFYLNTATGDGGGIQNSGSSLSLYHNTYRGNTAANGTGGAINNNSTGLTLNSSILFTNTASIDGGGLNSSSGAALSHNLYYDNLPNDVNSGGLGSNPITKNPRLYLFSLSRYSPAIDQADPLNLNPGVPAPGGQTIIDYDVGNYFRPDGIDQFHYATRAADIGADEYIKDWGCAVEPTPQQATVVPGQTTVYYFTIQNTGHVYPPATGVPWHGYTDTITITLASSSQNWATLEGDGTIVTLDWRESVVRALTVTVPVTASNGMADVSNVRCTSSAMPSRTRDGSATTSVGLVTGVIVHPNYFANAAPGQVLTFTHTVKNVGNDTGDFIVLPDAGAQNAAAILLDNNGIPISQTKVTLDPTEFITTRLRVSILGTASIGGIAKPGVIAVEENNTANFGSALNNINIIQAPGTRYVAIGGTDNTNCTSPNQPCGTIQYAVDQAASGDEIHVANGTYTNTVTRTVQGNALVQNLFIDESVTIRGGYTTAENPPFVSNYPITQAAHLDGQLDHRVIYIAPNVTVTLSSLFIEKGEAFHDAFIPDRFYGGGVYNNGANLTITGTWFITNYGRYGAGLYQVGDNLRVNSSVFEHNNNRNNANLFGAGAGIMLTGTVQTAVIENNTFVANRVNEIGSLTSLSPTSLSNVDGSGGAIFASSGVLTLTNNIMDHNNGQSLATAVYISPTVVYTSNHNLFWDSRSSITFTNYISGPNSLFGDPTFLDTYYHIGPLSAAKDTGNSNTTYPWAVDFDLDARIMGSSIDIGADERIQRPNFIVVPISQTAVVTAGVPYTYTHILTNTGDNIDSYTLVMSNQQLPPGGTWNVSLLPPAQINNLGLMQSALITFVISGTDPGFMNLTTITATAASSNQQHTVQDTTTVRFTPGVDIAQSENGFGNSGQPISYTHTLTNTGNGIDRYSLQPIANNPAWIVSVQPTQTAFITTGGTMPFTVTVNVPPGTPANTVHQVQIEALSLSPISNTVRDTLTDTTTVTVSYGLALIPPTATLTVLDGATAVFNHSLQNTGNITDTANLTVTGVPTSWSISVQPLNMQLGLGQSKLVTVSVTAPVGSGGIVHTAVLTATSNGDPQVQATAVDTTTVQTSFGVQLEPDQQQIDDAGNTVLYNHTITNTGNAPDTFDLSGRSDLGWATSFTPGPISLTSGATDVVTVAVTIPLTATPGLQNTTVITAVSQTNSAAFDTATDQTRMRQNHGLILAPDRTGTTAPSSVISYMHWLTNTGNGLDTYTVTVSSSNGWGVAGPGLINLSSGQSASVMVTLTVPSGTSGSVDLMTVTAASIISPTFTDSVVNTTTVSGTPPTYGVLIAPDNTGSGQVNTIVQYQHTVTNSGTVMDNYTLNVVSQQGWTATVTPSSLTGISAGSTRSVTVDITILGNAAVGATDVATVTVTSQQSPTTFDTATDSTSVDQTFAVQLEPDRQQAGTAGTSVTYTHWLTNSGNGADSFNITAASSHGWVTNTPGLVSLSAGQSSQITITLDIPPAAGAMGAVTDTMQVTAASVGQPSVSAFVIDSTTIPSGSAGTVAVVIGPDNAQTVNPGDVAVYQHTITNTGTLTDDFRITAVSSQGYSIVTAPGSGSVVRLTPGQSTSVQVRVTVPTTATDGTVDTTTVTANSVSFSSISDDAANTTTIQTGPRLLFLPVILRLAGGATPTPTPTTSTSTATPSPTPCVATGIDLVVTQIQVTPNPPVGGQQATVFVTIHNQGSANMVSGNNFFLDFYIDRVPQPLLVGDIVWGIQGDDLTAGTSKTYSAPFTFTSGAHDLYAQVDTDGTVDECPNENNNVLGPNPITATGTSSNGQVGGNNVPLSSPRQTPPPAIAVETETPTILPPTAVPTETETPEQVGTVTPEIPSPTAVPTETETPEQIETVTPDATPPPDLEPAATTDLRLQPSPTPE